MNRKNLTCAVLAGLAGVAGLAATAQAVNLNPDGLGQVLVYPYYTANDGNQTILSVVNTTNQAKAVKVRFLEGFNSREVLDFNLYMSHHDVWTAAIADDGAGTPTLYIEDSSCTVPYLYGMGVDAGLGRGEQPFLDLAYTGTNSDGGPDVIGRAAEGHFEMIEMGVLTGESAIDVTHDLAGDGLPADCDELTAKWSEVVGGTNGIWFDEANFGTDDCTIDDQACTDTERASGGLFGAAAVVNPANGTMYSYDAKAIQGFDKTANGLHYEPGTIFPSLRSGSEDDAWVFFGVPQNTAVQLDYSDPSDDLSVDAVSAVFMHENLMNEYSTDDDLVAGTEWVITFPTKAFYADEDLMVSLGINEEVCTGTGDDEVCVNVARAPFTQLFGAVDEDDNPLCEVVSLKTWDREENTFEPTGPGSVVIPPVVSPAPPRDCITGLEPACTSETVFQLCNEVNVLRFGERPVFGTPDFGADGSLLLSVEDEFENGWGRINLGVDGDGDYRTDRQGLVGLPVAGFAAYEFENDFVDGDGIKAFYGGLFGHKGNVRRMSVDD
jgi:hypothetical protein